MRRATVCARRRVGGGAAVRVDHPAQRDRRRPVVLESARRVIEALPGPADRVERRVLAQRVAASTISPSATARSSSKQTATPSSPAGPPTCTMKMTSCRKAATAAIGRCKPAQELILRSPPVRIAPASVDRGQDGFVSYSPTNPTAIRRGPQIHSTYRRDRSGSGSDRATDRRRQDPGSCRDSVEGVSVGCYSPVAARA